MKKHRLLTLIGAAASAALIAGISPSFADGTFDASHQITNQNVYFGQYNIDSEGSPDRANVITALSPQQYDQTLTALVNEEQESGVAGRRAEMMAGSEGVAGEQHGVLFEMAPTDRATDANH